MKKACYIFLLFLLCGNYTFVFSKNVTVNSTTNLVDGTIAPYNELAAGDTIFLEEGTREFLLIRNFQGEEGKPFIFINKTGIVTIVTSHNYGISIQNCQYFRLTGSGNEQEFYGIQIDEVENGTGIGVGAMSSDFELDHISIKNVPIGGIYAKTDPDCSLLTTRDKFVQRNTKLHDLYIENAGNEGIYVGSTKWYGQTISCEGKDTTVLPAVLEGVKIYNNVIKNSGWDGLQVSSAPKDCEVYGNRIYNDSQAEYENQMAGIILGGGSKCDCYNNLIVDGKGVGIENHGLGGNRIFNNVIVNAGQTFYPDNYDASKMKHGIFISDISTVDDSSYFVLHNTIMNPKSDGIRFASTKSKNNLLVSNAIINPGNYDYYEEGNTHFSGEDSYIMIPDESSDVVISNNFFSRTLADAKLMDDYSLTENSPLIDAAYENDPIIEFDFLYEERPSHGLPDIGAFEYQDNTSVFFHPKKEAELKLFPNPARNEIFLSSSILKEKMINIRIYNVSGLLVWQKKQITGNLILPSYRIPIKNLQRGCYFVSVSSGEKLQKGRFLKMN